MKRNENATCSNCPFSVTRTRYGRMWLECHRNAPRPVDGVTDDWPAVAIDDICGEHPDFWQYDNGAQDMVDHLTTTYVVKDGELKSVDPPNAIGELVEALNMLVRDLNERVLTMEELLTKKPLDNPTE